MATDTEVRRAKLRGCRRGSTASTARLDSDKLDAGQTTAACNTLSSFINQVNAYVSNGTLTAAQGQSLISAAQSIKTNLGC